MAYAVFTDSSKSAVSIICKDLNELNERALVGTETSGEISDTIFNDLISRRKDILSIDNGTITTSDHVEDMDAAEFAEYKASLNHVFDDFLANNSSSGMVTKLQAYKAILNNLSPTFPLTKSVEQHILDEGLVTSEADLFHPLRLY